MVSMFKKTVLAAAAAMVLTGGVAQAAVVGTQVPLTYPDVISYGVETSYNAQTGIFSASGTPTELVFGPGNISDSFYGGNPNDFQLNIKVDSNGNADFSSESNFLDVNGGFGEGNVAPLFASTKLVAFGYDSNPTVGTFYFTFANNSVNSSIASIGDSINVILPAGNISTFGISPLMVAPTNPVFGQSFRVSGGKADVMPVSAVVPVPTAAASGLALMAVLAGAGALRRRRAVTA